MSADVAAATTQLEAAAALDQEGKIKEALPLYLTSLEKLMPHVSRPGVRELVMRYMGRAEELKRVVATAPQRSSDQGAALRLMYPSAGPAERALLLLRDGLAPLLDEVAAQAGAQSFPSPAVELDPHRLLSLVWQHWAGIFQRSHAFPHADADNGWTRTLIAELRHWRNAHAHQHGRAALDASDVYRVVDSAERLLGRATATGSPSARDFAAEVRRMKPNLLPAMREELAPVEIGLSKRN